MIAFAVESGEGQVLSGESKGSLGCGRRGKRACRISVELLLPSLSISLFFFFFFHFLYLFIILLWR